MEEPVTFQNKNGDRLFGIVHIPERLPSGGRKVGVNLLNPGIKYRVAPNRLNIKLARRLCDKGYYVLRFDPAGIGDSEGELPENLLITDIWEKIQTGIFVADTISANNFFFKSYQLNELILMGNCGGAITALLASAEDPRVEALCLIDVPVNLRTTTMSFADKVAEGGKKSDWMFSEYMKKLLSWKAWFRFITLQTDYKALYKVITIKCKKYVSSHESSGLPMNLESLCREKKLNRLFFESFEACVKDKISILFILAGNDPGTEIFQLYFQSGYLKENQQERRYDDLIQFFLIENANHIYTLSEWQESLMDKIANWITNYPLQESSSSKEPRSKAVGD